MDFDTGKRVLFLGEDIIDVYHYGRLIGRTMKEPILALEYERSQAFKGGVFAAAAHALEFCRWVDIESHVTVRKTRFVEAAHTRKLFEYCSQPKPCEWLPDHYSDYDALVVCDYGHGMFTPELIAKVCREAKFLAVNVQTNSSNYGYNLATKWPGCDYLCMDEMEARLATQNQRGDIRESLGELKFIAPKIAVTVGAAGAIGWSAETSFVTVPAFTEKVVDTMGCGDAFFAVSALFADKLGIADLLKIGNAAGAVKVKILGHSASVTKAAVEKYLNASVGYEKK